VGKTEIARRLAKLANSPFLKWKRPKFTEVGYVGRDVESMIRDLVDIAIDMVREEKLEDVADKAELNAEERLLDILLPRSHRVPVNPIRAAWCWKGHLHRNRKIEPGKNCASNYAKASWTDRMVEIDVRERNFPSFEIISNQGVEEMDVNIKDNAA